MGYDYGVDPNFPEPAQAITATLHFNATGGTNELHWYTTFTIPLESSEPLPPGASHVEVYATFLRDSLIARLDHYLEERWEMKVLNRWTDQRIIVGQVETSLDLKPAAEKTRE